MFNEKIRYIMLLCIMLLCIVCTGCRTTETVITGADHSEAIGRITARTDSIENTVRDAAERSRALETGQYELAEYIREYIQLVHELERELLATTNELRIIKENLEDSNNKSSYSPSSIYYTSDTRGKENY